MMNDPIMFIFTQEEQGRKAGGILVDPAQAYTMERGHGFTLSSELSRNEELRDSWPGEYVIPAVPTFLIDVPYGNYHVSIELGGGERASSTTVLGGLGCLMLDDIRTAPGENVREVFAMHVDDGQLKLAFAGDAPLVRAVEIRRDASIRTLFLAGDSTVTEQPSGKYPYTGWGQGLGKWLNAGVAISNHAKSGASTKSFISEGILRHIVSRLRESDILLIQFAHNDNKKEDKGTLPYSTYQDGLRTFIQAARSRGASPVLVTPMHRRAFDGQGRIRDTHGDYIDAMLQVAKEEGVPCIDLAARSKSFFEACGEAETKSVFMWTGRGEYPGWPEGTEDNTHFSRAGGMEIARLVVEYVRDEGVEPLAGLLRG